MANKKFNKSKKVKAPAKTDSDIKQDLQDLIIENFNDDFFVAEQNMEVVNKNFDEYYKMVHCVRQDQENDWESKIALPEFVSRLLTQVGNFVAQYFGSRDFVETDDDTDDPKQIAEAKAGKTLLNTILNDPKAYYFQKTVRMLMFGWPSGWSVIKGGYDQRIEKYVSAQRTSSEPVINESGEYLAEDGGVYADPYSQKPAMNETSEDIYGYNVISDKPTFDVYPNQNVYFSPEYTYSLQEKEYVVFEDESMTLEKLEMKKEQNGYFNLNILKEMQQPDATNEIGKKTFNIDGEFKDIDHSPSPKFRILEWWRKYPIIIKARNPETRKITEFETGLDKDGEMKKGATLEECIITTASLSTVAEKDTVLIGLRPSPHTARPMVRFLCYIDALSDTGFGDGELSKQLSIAMDDNFNLGNFRTKLATTPAFKGRRFAGIPDKIKFGPENVTLLEELDDLQEIITRDDIQGTMVQNQMLGSRMDYAMATSPQTMGHGPERAETATQAGIVSQRAEVRIGMKTTTLEMVGFTELYNMLLTLCSDFMLPDTIERILGEELVYSYNPTKLNLYRPVSQALETEESKSFKMKMINQLIGLIVAFPNPKTAMTLNYFIGQFLEAAGKNFKHYKKFMFSEDPEINLLYTLATGGKMAQQPAQQSQGGGPSNQNGVQQGVAEQGARQAAQA